MMLLASVSNAYWVLLSQFQTLVDFGSNFFNFDLGF